MLPNHITKAFNNYIVGAKIATAKPRLKTFMHTMLYQCRKELVACKNEQFSIEVFPKRIIVTLSGDVFTIQT